MKNHVRDLRQALGWSQSELAKRLEVSRQTVHSIEAEKYDPSLPLAFRIAWVFGCGIEDVFQPDPAHRRPGAQPAAPADRGDTNG